MRLTKLNIFLLILLVAGALAGLAAYLFASVRAAQPPYLTLENTARQPAAKIEIVEFFWYGCPHCHKYEPVLAAWVQKHADQVTLRRVPVGLHQRQVPQQKMYYAFDALGKLDALHPAIFEHIHVGEKALNTDAAILQFATSRQLGEAQWRGAYESAGVQEQVRAATQLQRDYKVERVPSVVIGGRYVTSPSMVGMSLPYLGQTDEIRYRATEKLMDELLGKLLQEGARP